MWHILRRDADDVLEDEKVKASLRRYLAVMKDEKPAKFMIAKKIPADFDDTYSIPQLWRIHEQKLEEFTRLEREIDSNRTSLMNLEDHITSLLDLKQKIAERILESCHLCTRRCDANRLKGQKGYCGCGEQARVSSFFEHMGEEPELTPSGTVFTLGCTMRCLHCQNWTISQWIEQGEAYSPQRLASAVEQLRRNGCRNVNLVGGEPTPWLEQWLEVFKLVGLSVPVVWNSNTYYSEETAQLLGGFADVYLLDFKYGNDDCARRISDAPSYWEVCTRNHLHAAKHGELIIRVLVLPGHLECCTNRILCWVSKNLGENTRVNLMFQYRPEWRANEVSELRRRLTADEMRMATQLAERAGLTNCVT
jgi:putative pyruvate formate lyase activating enzyme